MFSQFHKKLFKSEIINGHHYILSFIKELKVAYEESQERKQLKQTIAVDAIIDELYTVLLQLDKDINSGLQESEAPGSIANEEDDFIGITTYEQLNQRIRDRYTGYTFSQQVNTYLDIYYPH